MTCCLSQQGYIVIINQPNIPCNIPWTPSVSNGEITILLVYTPQTKVAGCEFAGSGRISLAVLWLASHGKHNLILPPAMQTRNSTMGTWQFGVWRKIMEDPDLCMTSKCLSRILKILSNQTCGTIGSNMEHCREAFRTQSPSLLPQHTFQVVLKRRAAVDLAPAHGHGRC